MPYFPFLLAIFTLLAILIVSYARLVRRKQISEWDKKLFENAYSVYGSSGTEEESNRSDEEKAKAYIQLLRRTTKEARDIVDGTQAAYKAASKIWTFDNIMLGFITVAVLLASLFVILSKIYDESEKKWAYSAISMLIGYWLKPSRR